MRPLLMISDKVLSSANSADISCIFFLISTRVWTSRPKATLSAMELHIHCAFYAENAIFPLLESMEGYLCHCIQTQVTSKSAVNEGFFKKDCPNSLSPWNNSPFCKTLTPFQEIFTPFYFSETPKKISRCVADFMKSTIFAAANGSLFAEIKRESGVNPEQSRCCEFYNEGY